MLPVSIITDDFSPLEVIEISKNLKYTIIDKNYRHHEKRKESITVSRELAASFTIRDFPNHTRNAHKCTLGKYSGV